MYFRVLSSSKIEVLPWFYLTSFALFPVTLTRELVVAGTEVIISGVVLCFSFCFCPDGISSMSESELDESLDSL